MLAERRAPVAEYAPRSAAALAFGQLWSELKEVI